MEIIMKKLIAIIALLGFVSFAQANGSFVVKAKFYDNKNLIGSPTLVVELGKEASINIDGKELSVVVSKSSS
jgi:hypothetical protein